jgi:hypothetical protein
MRDPNGLELFDEMSSFKKLVNSHLKKKISFVLSKKTLSTQHEKFKNNSFKN